MNQGKKTRIQPPCFVQLVPDVDGADTAAVTGFTDSLLAGEEIFKPKSQPCQCCNGFSASQFIPIVNRIQRQMSPPSQIPKLDLTKTKDRAFD